MKWSPTHRCNRQDPNFGKDLIFKLMNVETKEDLSSPLDVLDTLNPVLRITQVDSASQQFIQAPIKINGHQIRGGVDTHASNSFLSPSFIKKLNVPVIPMDGKIVLGASGQDLEELWIYGSQYSRRMDLQVICHIHLKFWIWVQIEIVSWDWIFWLSWGSPSKMCQSDFRKKSFA
jgi:hypothetical protein